VFDLGEIFFRMQVISAAFRVDMSRFRESDYGLLVMLERAIINKFCTFFVQERKLKFDIAERF
jgi:hypothetical protein